VRRAGAIEMGKRLREGRKQSGFTIAEVIAKTICNKAHLSRLEEGKIVDPTGHAVDIIIDLAHLYSIEPEPLLKLVGRCSVPTEELSRKGKNRSSIHNLTSKEATELRRYLSILRGRLAR
jgi:transcriptional regulator with XRE-family HTH domain